MDKLLSIQDLVVRFYTYEGVVQALEGVDLDIAVGETFGLVGETGCGKTLTALSIMVLIPSTGKIENGRINFQMEAGGEPVDLLLQNEAFLRSVRGREISMVFQEPSAALNPVYTVNAQISEVLLLHRKPELYQRARDTATQRANANGGWLVRLKRPLYRMVSSLYAKTATRPQSAATKLLSRIPFLESGLKAEARRMAISLLKEMEIADAEGVISRYPHELSGGMQQRVVIAMALACNPRLLIADEPTTSLDVTIQAQILELLRRLKEERGSSLLYITHNLGVVAEICDRVGVMYAGSLCEVAPVAELFSNPLHPYTRALLEAIPNPHTRFKTIPGTVPNLTDPPPGCRFHPRCPQAMQRCSQKQPNTKEITQGHRVACYLY
jgi:peptide/nickel transport system ATP-binding protein